MNLVHIAAFSILSLLVGWLPNRWRRAFILILSLIAVYWLQPSSPIRNLDFWLPTAAIGLILVVWAVTAPKGSDDRLWNLLFIASATAFILLLGITRYYNPLCCLTASRPPQFAQVVIACVLIFAAAMVVYRITAPSRRLAGAMILVIIALFIIIKYQPSGALVSSGLRTIYGQNPAMATALDISWLGFSFLAFRLLHTLRDFQTGRLPAFRSDEYTTYALFYPSLTAGPIDRSQRFIQTDLRNPDPVSTAGRLLGIQRIIIGAFKKFVIADALALIALSPQLIPQVNSTFWMWLLLYAFSLRIYFDFAGYTDIAIGIGLLVGIQLPENFNRPYLTTNLTAFWNSWHITLANWFRSYVFNPLTRNLRGSPLQIPSWVIILTGQSLTMLLIGLWHGISWSFAIWGLWHGIGLFIHNRWSNWIRPYSAQIADRHKLRKVLSFGGWLLTFNYVALGWVWFMLPEVNLAVDAFYKLFGN